MCDVLRCGHQDREGECMARRINGVLPNDCLQREEPEELWWECKYCGENVTPGCHKCVREDGAFVTDELVNEAEWRQDTMGDR